MSSPVTTLLASAGLPADNLLTKREMLPEPLQLLHRRTLLALGQVGEPPTRDQLQEWASELRIDLDASLHQLAQAELVFLDPAGREITGGVPFAPPLPRTGSPSTTARPCSRTVPSTPWAWRRCSAAMSTSSPATR